ncbi:MAG: hypothetical protein ACRCVY_07145 [Commensalibacter sp.]|nr:hypothetical protein [Commensalibacter sp.]
MNILLKPLFSKKRKVVIIPNDVKEAVQSDVSFVKACKNAPSLETGKLLRMHQIMRANPMFFKNIMRSHTLKKAY